MIQFDCPECGHRMRAPESVAGKRGPCKGCGATVVVPSVAVERPPAIAKESQNAIVVAAGSGQAPVSPVVKRLANDEQDPAVVEKIVAKAEPLMMAGEEIRYVAVQQRPVANFTPDAIVLTDKRFMYFRTKLLGRFDFSDFVWRDLRDAKINVGMLGATVSIATASGQRISVDYLPKKQAREVYRFSQEKEESALEERRQRALEEKRAASGMPVFVPPQAATSPGISDPMAKLTQLKAMLDSGLISQDEFVAKKTKLLAEM